MGIFDGGDIDPLTGGLLGATSAYAQGLGPSRLPINPMQGILGAIGGFGQGYQGTQMGNAKYKLYAQEAEKNALANAQLISHMNYMAMRHPEMFPNGVGGLLGQAGYGGAGGLGAGAVGGGMGGGVPVGQGGGQGAPAASAGGSVAASMAGAPGGGGLFDRETEGKIIDAQYMGIPNDVIAKQVPGPTALMQALKDANIDPKSALGQQYIQWGAQKAAGVDPFQEHREGSTTTRVNPLTGLPEAVFYAPKMPEASILARNPDGSMSMAPIQGARPTIAQIEGGKQDARVAAENALKTAEFERQYGFRPPGGGGNGSIGNYNMGGAAPGGGQASNAGAGNSAAANPGDITTPKGTVVPSPVGAQKLGPSGDEAGLQFKNSAETEKNWNSIRPSIEQNRQRLGALSEAFQQVETKGYTVAKTEIANKLRGLGLTGVADTLQGAKDTAAVQSALWNGMQEVLQSLKVVNQGTGGRILNSEFNAYMEHSFSPDMVGPALHKAISAQLGQTYQVGNMIDDYYKTGKLAGWRDANQYQSAYLSKNPVENFVDYATQTTPQFKGMDKAIPPDVLKDANNALLRGAPKEAIRKRLQENGYDASKF